MQYTKHQMNLHIASIIATRTTCIRRGVGCVLVNARGEILSTGYNGVASGQPHCSDNLGKHCSGSSAKTGENLEGCQAIHAEQNALMQCANVQEIEAAYVTASPCMHCMKMLLNTSCKHIYALEVYDDKALDLWVKSGRAFSLASVD